MTAGKIKRAPRPPVTAAERKLMRALAQQGFTTTEISRRVGRSPKAAWHHTKDIVGPRYWARVREKIAEALSLDGDFSGVELAEAWSVSRTSAWQRTYRARRTRRHGYDRSVTPTEAEVAEMRALATTMGEADIARAMDLPIRVVHIHVGDLTFGRQHQRALARADHILKLTGLRIGDDAIAERLGVPVNQVRVERHRALRRLASMSEAA